MRTATPAIFSSQKRQNSKILMTLSLLLIAGFVDMLFVPGPVEPEAGALVWHVTSSTWVAAGAEAGTYRLSLTTHNKIN